MLVYHVSLPEGISNSDVGGKFPYCVRCFFFWKTSEDAGVFYSKVKLTAFFV